MTRIALIGDTHMGCSGSTEYLLEKKFGELKKEDFDFLIHTGDWISHSQDQLEPLLSLIRRHIDKPIIGVMGNHDYWNSYEPMTIKKISSLHKRLFKKYGIFYLEGSKPFRFGENLSVWGFNGWYGNTNPPTNDKYRMPKMENNIPIHEYLSGVAHKRLERIITQARNTPGNKICVTHFPPYTFNQRYLSMCACESYLDLICEEFSHFIVGHSHQKEDWVRLNCRVVNPGGDYDSPNYKIIEV